jgi:hypothetical protein
MSTPPRKPRNPENIFRRGNEHNIRATRESMITHAAAKDEETAEERFERFLEEGVHPSTLSYRDFEPGIHENVDFFNENGGLLTPEMMGMELFEEYRMAYAQRYGRRNANRPSTKRKRSAFNNALNNANNNVAPSTPVRVRPTLSEPPALIRGPTHIQRFFENENNNVNMNNNNNNAKTTNGFGRGGKRRSAKRSNRKTRRAHRK